MMVTKYDRYHKSMNGFNRAVIVNKIHHLTLIIHLNLMWELIFYLRNQSMEI